MEPMKPMKPMKPMEPLRPMEFDAENCWWPKQLGNPNASGSQNDVHYAYFRASKRLLLRQGDSTTAYDTGDNDIIGVSQASDTTHARFETQGGTIDVAQFKQIK